MFDLLKLMLLAAALLPGSMLAAQTAQPEASAASDSTITIDGKKQKKVCRNFPAPTGSRHGARKVCKTAFEWRVEEAQLQQSLHQMDMVSKANRAQDWNDKNQSGFGQPLPR